MKIEVSSQVLAHPRERIYGLLLDPAVLARLLPGVEKLEATGPDQYAVVVRLGVGAIRGTYTGKVALVDLHAPESFRLIGEAKGGPGWAKAGAAAPARASRVSATAHPIAAPRERPVRGNDTSVRLNAIPRTGHRGGRCGPPVALPAAGP